MIRIRTENAIIECDSADEVAEVMSRLKLKCKSAAPMADEDPPSQPDGRGRPRSPAAEDVIAALKAGKDPNVEKIAAKHDVSEESVQSMVYRYSRKLDDL
jgi:hypothetical protein